MNGCAAPAGSFVLTPGLVEGAHGPQLGWILMAFCGRHKRAVLDYVEPRVGPLGEDAIVAEIAALPAALHAAGIDAKVEGLDYPVVTNVFGVRTG